MPLFIVDSQGSPEPIKSIPGQYRYPIPHLLIQCGRLIQAGITAIALFPVIDPSLKDSFGSEALKEDNLLLRAVRQLRTAYPDLLIVTDIALDPYTSHGHDGIFDPTGQAIDNDATLKILAQMAVLQAQAGATFVAPSDMMDGRVAAIRSHLDEEGWQDIGILAYSAKFASAYYGPFREAIGSNGYDISLLKDKRTYQMNPANRREALLETQLDEAEGADILMIKPAGPYLDIIREVRERTLLPIAAYQVSGEYAQICAAAQLGWMDREQARDEALLAIKRSGADMIMTYFAGELAGLKGISKT